MARSYGRILVAIWNDEEFLALDPPEKLVYLMLATQATISPAGVLAITINRWANKALSGDLERLTLALKELDRTRFVVIDDYAEELLVRTFVKHDGGTDNPNRTKAVLASIKAIGSSRIRSALAIELDRLGVAHTITDRDEVWPAESAPETVSETVGEGVSDTVSERVSEGPDSTACCHLHTDTQCCDPDDCGPCCENCPTCPTLLKIRAAGEPSPNRSENPSANGMSNPLVKDQVALTTQPKPEALASATSITGSLSSSELRADVERVCKHLADAIEANGSKRPTIGVKWRTEARLMLDADKIAEDKIHGAIDWSQRHEFWKTVILSMTKLRSKYDAMRLRAEAEQRAKPATANRRRNNDDKVDTGLEIARRLATADGPQPPELENPS
jgi:hypothetical protein